MEQGTRTGNTYKVRKENNKNKDGKLLLFSSPDETSYHSDDNTDLSEEGRKLVDNDYDPHEETMSSTTRPETTGGGWGFTPPKQVQNNLCLYILL